MGTAVTTSSVAARRDFVRSAKHVVYPAPGAPPDPLVKIVSDVAAPAERFAELAKRIHRAYAFDLRQGGWGSVPGLHRQIEISVLQHTTSGYPAAALDGDHVEFGPYLVRGPSFRADTDAGLAHELTHIQDWRALPGRRILAYIGEGKAVVMGCRMELAGKTQSKDFKTQVGYLVALTANQARHDLARYRSGKVGPQEDEYRYEVVGALFVEFLRTHLGGQRKEDSVPKLNAMFLESGAGPMKPELFKRYFGVGPDEAEKRFVAFVGDTEGKPKKRLGETVWANGIASRG